MQKPVIKFTVATLWIWALSLGVLHVATTPAEANSNAKASVRAPKSSAANVTRHGDDSSTLPLRLAVSLAINAGLYGLYAAWRGAKPENSRRVHSRPRQGHVARPLVLRQADGVDPATMRDGTEIKPLGRMGDMGDSGNDAADPDIATLALDPLPVQGEPAIVVKAPPPQSAAAGPKASKATEPRFRFPGRLGDAFEPLPGERIKGEYPFAVPLYCEGIVAITNYRVLAVRRSWNWSVLPPKLHVESKRHRIKLGTIEATEDHHVQRPVFLLAAAGFSWWLPFGLIPAAAMLSAFFLCPREEIAIRFDGDAMRSWPLSPEAAARFRLEAEDAVLAFRAAVHERKKNRPA